MSHKDSETFEPLHQQPEWLRTTLSSIGDAVITTDNHGLVTFLNPVAQALTGWSLADAQGQPLEAVFQIVNETTRLTVENPAHKALREGVVVGLANHTLLIAKDGNERPIDDSAAPIRNAAGEIAGVVLVFHDVTERKRTELLVHDSLAYADNIIATMREPFLVLDQDLRVVTANRSFYENFHVAAGETQGQFVYDLGNRQWDIPALRTLLEEVLPQNQVFQDFEVQHDFPTLGRKTMLLNARRIRRPGNQSELILLAIEDVTAHHLARDVLQVQNERLQLLGVAAATLLFADDHNVVLQGLIEKLSPLLGIDSYRSYVVDESGGFLRLVSYAGITEADARAIERLEFGQPMCHAVASGRQSCVAVNIEPSDKPLDASATSFGSKACACFPLMSDNDLLGTLYFSSQSKAEFAPDELTFLQTIAHYVAAAYAQQRTQKILQASEKQLRLILDSMPPKIATTLPKGDVNYFNPQWMEYTGLSFEQLRDSGWQQVMHPDEVDDHVRSWKQSIESGKPFEFESRLRRADGEYRWHINRANAMRDEMGRITMWVGSSADIHDIKQTELVLLDSEVRYRRLFEAAKDGILILDYDTGKIIDANPFMTEILGYSHDILVGQELWQIGLFADKPACELAVTDIQTHGYKRYEHLPLKTSQGRQVEVEIVANVYRENRRQVIQCNIRDITERHTLELLLRGQATELSDLHRRKDEFLAMLSHELRSPLAPISNAVELMSLHSGNENKFQLKARGIITRQLGQLQHLVDDLLEVSRITTGRIQLRRERVAVAGIVEGAIETVRPLLEKRQHELTVALPPDPIWLNADFARIEQVLVNLLTNAVKYTETAGHIWLTVESQGQECVLRVRDDGEGISPTLMPRLFDLFTQAERSLDRSQGGLGIGLALVKRLTELHGGNVEANSVLGQGSEFVVRLPLFGAGTTELESAPAETGQTAVRPLRVLAVDDNEDTVLGFSMLLEAIGHEVFTAHDGIAAVQAAIKHTPDVILLDIGLPGLNGYEVAQRIRQIPALHDVVLVALTGYGQDSDKATSLEAGFNHHLVKPASFTQLRQILATVVSQRGGG